MRPRVEAGAAPTSPPDENRGRFHLIPNTPATFSIPDMSGFRTCWPTHRIGAETASRRLFPHAASPPTNPSNPFRIESRNPETAGHAVPVNQSVTDFAAPLIPSHAPVTTVRKVSDLFHATASPTPSATSARTTRPIGFANIAAFKSHCFAAASDVAADRLPSHFTNPPAIEIA